MAISINNYAFNESRIQTILNANSLVEAQRMGIIEYVMDFLRGGVQRAQIEALFKRIEDYSNGSDSESERLLRFDALRSLATREHADKFRVDVAIAADQSAWSYTLSVGDRQIFSKTDIVLGDDTRDYEMCLEAVNRNCSQPIEEESEHCAPQAGIAALKRDMAAFLKTELLENGNEFIEFYLNDAVVSKLGDIPCDASFWQSGYGSRDALKRRIKQEVFPHDDKAAVMEYVSGDRRYTDAQKSALIDLLTLTDKEFQYHAFAELYCQKKQIDFSAIDFDRNHFYIRDKGKNFIPGDGNCLFHCLDYLQQQSLSVAPIAAYA